MSNYIRQSGRINLQLKALNDLNLTNEAEKLAKLSQEVELAEKSYAEVLTKLNDVIQEDRNEEERFKRIEIEHSDRIKDLDIKENELKSRCKAKKDELDKISAEIPPLQVIAKSWKDNIERLKKEVSEIEENKQVKVKDFNETKEKYESILQGLGAEIIKKRDELIDTDFRLNFSKKELERTTKKINEENVLIDIRRKDLEIYEARIKKEDKNNIII